MPPERTAARPNVLMIVADQMRADHLGHAGHPVARTPHLDRLAHEGVSFSRAYVNSPLCMPSRASLFTGRTPRGHGVRANGIPLDPALPTLPARLAAEGYRTAGFGKIHLQPYEGYDGAPPRDVRFEHRDTWAAGEAAPLPVPYYGLEEVALTIGHGTAVEGDYAAALRAVAPDAWTRLRGGPTPSPRGAEGCGTYPLPEALHHSTWVADRTVEFLEARAPDDPRPFYALCSFPDPHHPYVPPAPWDRAYAPENVPDPIGDPDDVAAMPPHVRDARHYDAWVSGRRRATDLPAEHLREIHAHTLGMVSLLDAQVGRLLDTLEARNLRRDTLVVFLSDHGDLMGDHGLLNKGPFHYEGLLRVPMIWSWPRRFQPRRSEALASLLDVVPTLLAAVGLDADTFGDAPGVQAQPRALPGTSLVPVLEGSREAVQSAVVVENDEDYLGLRVRTLVTPGAKLTTYTDQHGAAPYGELFDLRDDPEERRNRWNDPAWADRRRDLMTGLHHALVRTDDASTRRLGHA